MVGLKSREFAGDRRDMRQKSKPINQGSDESFADMRALGGRSMCKALDSLGEPRMLSLRRYLGLKTK